MNAISPQPSVTELPLAAIDVSDPGLYASGEWQTYFRRLRDENPVHYCANSAFGPYWSITRYEDIVKVDSDFKTFSSEPAIIIGGLGSDFDGELENFIAMDPPRHDVQRRAVQPVVAPQNLREMEGLIRQRVVEILDGLPVGETFDWVEAVSINLTTQMLATLFDFPFEDRAKLTYWSDIAAGTEEISGGDVTSEERFTGLSECLAYFTELWHQRKGQPGGFDLISLLQRDENTADMVDRPMEYLGNLGLLIVGGNDTTRNSITGSVLALHENPEQFAMLKANPELIPSMVSETIRWQTPLAHMARRATRDVELGGQQIRAGDKVVMWYISGNRDERNIERPDEYRIDRANPRQHLSFGFGVHRCMGNRLAEMQLRVLWEEILARFDRIEVVGEPTRLRSNFVHGYTQLPTRVIPK